MPRRKFFYSLIIAVGFFVLAKSVWAGDVIINEIGAYEPSGHEWVEIFNRGSGPVDLSGWKFWEDNTNHGLTISSTDSILNPSEYGVICQDAEKFWLDFPFFGGSVFDSSWGSLNESGEEIGLKDADGNFVEKFIYLSAPNYSLERKDPLADIYDASNWSEHVSSNTVGAVNSNFGFLPPSPTTTLTTTPTEDTSTIWAALRLNEIVSDPSDGNEWAEFYNPTTSSLDLVGGFLCDNRGATSTADCKDLSGTIGAGGFLVFDWSGYFFNNDFDSAILKNPSGEILDQVNYGDGILEAPEKGQSLARTVSGAGAWAITTAITPGAENNIVAPIVENVGGGSSGDYIAPKTTVKTTTTTTSTKSTTSSAKKENFVVWKIKYPTKILVGEKIEFDATGTLDARGGRFDFLWNLGEGTVTGTKTQFVFASSGPHNITIFATSSAGTVGNKSFKIMVYTTSTVPAPVAISAVLPNESGADDEEYIKIKNLSTSSVNISGWKLFYKDVDYIIPASTTIFGNDELIFYKAITKFSLNNSGGEIELRDANDFVVDIFDYGKTVAGKEILLSSASSTSSVVLISTNTLGVVSKNKTVGLAVWGKSLSETREATDGAWAKVTGVVSVLPGIFGSQYFYTSDETGGLQIYQYKKDFPPLQIGDKVTVQGTMGTAYNERRLKIKDKYAVDILSTNNDVPEQEVDLSELDETQLGGLVKIQGEITEIKSNFMYVDNGAGEVQVYFKQGAGINKSLFKEGENVSVVGILANSKTGLQIWPRSQNDLASLGPSDDLLKAQAALQSAQNNSKQTAEKYLTATVGGISALILAFFARARGAILLGGVKKAASLAARLIKRG